MPKTENFQINGHEYTVICHQTREATRLVMDIYGALAGPGLELIKTIAEARGSVSLESDVSEIFEFVDSDKLATQIQTALTQLEESQIRQLFEKTQRDNHDLSQDPLYNEAYEQNWSEWLQAIYHIVKANGFLGFLFTMIESGEPPNEEDQAAE